MGIVVKLRCLSSDGHGRYVFRRRIPARHQQRIGRAEFKRRFVAASPSDVAREHARIMREFAALVEDQVPAQATPTAPPPTQLSAETTHSRRQQNKPKTMADALALYEQDKLERGRNRTGVVGLRRVRTRLPLLSPGRGAGGVVFHRIREDCGLVLKGHSCHDGQDICS